MPAQFAPLPANEHSVSIRREGSLAWSDTFLDKIKDPLGSILNFRNCIAHNKSYQEYSQNKSFTEINELISSYEKNRKFILKEIKNFWEEIETTLA